MARGWGQPGCDAGDAYSAARTLKECVRLLFEELVAALDDVEQLAWDVAKLCDVGPEGTGITPFDLVPVRWATELLGQKIDRIAGGFDAIPRWEFDEWFVEARVALLDEHMAFVMKVEALTVESLPGLVEQATDLCRTSEQLRWMLGMLLED